MVGVFRLLSKFTYELVRTCRDNRAHNRKCTYLAILGDEGLGDRGVA